MTLNDNDYRREALMDSFSRPKPSSEKGLDWPQLCGKNFYLHLITCHVMKRTLHVIHGPDDYERFVPMKDEKWIC